jgi:myo-inositol-1(or 4)-monophosphatase
VPRSPRELAEVALLVAREAGAVALTGWRTRPTATAKQTPTDLVTEYDLRVERLIRERLADLTPELPVVAEEEGGATKGDIAFCCDPIDGTTNFAHGHHYWAVSIGVLVRGAPVAGAVVAPALETSWTGWQDGPALRNGEPCRVSATTLVGEAVVATGFPYDRSREPDNNFSSFFRVKQAVRAVRRCGAAAIDVCLVADGTYDAFWERELHAWDLAGAAAVALAAGARVTALDGGPPVLERGHVLVSNGRVHDGLRGLICGASLPAG